jgi:hypothetical protein
MGRIMNFVDHHGDVVEFDLLDDGMMFVSTNERDQVLVSVSDVAELYHALSYIVPKDLK